MDEILNAWTTIKQVTSGFRGNREELNVLVKCENVVEKALNELEALKKQPQEHPVLEEN